MTTIDVWTEAGTALVAKMLGEWSYEGLLDAQAIAGTDRWSMRLGAVDYEFTARRGAFDALIVDPTSITRSAEDGTSPATDPVTLLLDARDALGLDATTLCDVVRDLTATHAADVRLAERALPASAVADLPYEQLEGQQTGHPCMVLNKGRLGFAASDSARFAPEAARHVRLQWIAVHDEIAATAGVERSHRELIAHELDDATRAQFAYSLRAAVGDAEDRYVWVPVHPFHWDEAVATLFAADVARRRIVHLGEGPDRYLPLQSIRTLTNVDSAERHDVKLPLLIRNTLVWRGLAPDATQAAPAVTAWLHGILAADTFLRDECRMVVLGEVASATVRHDVFAAVQDAPYRYHELLGAVWREPVRSFLAGGERARTMASLLHVGADGRCLVAELIERSPLEPEAWLLQFFRALFPPLLHWLYTYGVAFCPHGENTVLIFDANEVPTRIAVKDLAEDVNLVPEPLPEQGQIHPDADRVLLRWEPHDLRHSIISAICAGHLRFLAPLVETQLGIGQPRFWQLARQVIEAHHARFAQFGERIARFGILDPKVERVCLNREQLTGGGFHDRAERDESFDVTSGLVPNPLCGHA